MDLRSLAQNHMTFMSRANEAAQRRDMVTSMVNSSKAHSCVMEVAMINNTSLEEARVQINQLNQGK